MSVSTPVSNLNSLLSTHSTSERFSPVEPLSLNNKYSNLASATTSYFDYELVYTNPANFGSYFSLIDTGIRAALDYWKQFISASADSTVSIEISYTPEQGNTLASAGSPFYESVDQYNGMPVYKNVLESKIQDGIDSNGSDADASIDIATLDLSQWWFDSTPEQRLDNTPGQGQFDFTGVILHEFGHALGFSSLYEYPTADSFAAPYDALSVFDTFLDWDTVSNSQGQTEYTNFVFTGPNANAAYAELGGTGMVPIYAEPGQPGSSLSHYDGVTDANSLLDGFLMNPSVADGALLDVSTLDLAFLQDIGYTLATPDEPDTMPNNEFIPVTPTDTASDLLDQITTSATGITIDDSSIQLISAEGATSKFSSFNFGGNVAMTNSGLLLTSGDATPPASNTSGSYSEYNGVDGDFMFQEYIQQVFSGAGGTNDASIFEFSFTVDSQDIKSVSFDLIFGSDEFPEYADSSFVDVAALFVNGENYAYFDEDVSKPLSIVGNTVDSGRLYANDNSQYAIEYDGISPVITVNVPVVAGETYDIRLGVADTGDSALDSGLFVSNFNTNTSETSGTYVQVVAGDEGGTFEAPADGTGTMFVAGTGENTFIGSTSKDVYNLLKGGQNTLQGNISQLADDYVLGFGEDDKVLITGLEVSQEDYEVIMGSAIINIDTDKDGVKESTITLQGNYENTSFNFINTADGVEISYAPTPQADPQGTALVTTLIEELSLTGLSQGVTLAVGARFDQMDNAGFFSDSQLTAVLMASPGFVTAFADQGIEGFSAIVQEIGNAKTAMSNSGAIEITGSSSLAVDDALI